MVGLDLPCFTLFLCRLCSGMAGQSRLEQARADMVVDCAMDMMEPIMPAYREQNPEKKVRARQPEDFSRPCYSRCVNVELV